MKDRLFQLSYSKFRKEIEITNMIKTIRILKAGLQTKFTPNEWKAMKEEAAFKRVWYFDDSTNAGSFDQNEGK